MSDWLKPVSRMSPMLSLMASVPVVPVSNTNLNSRSSAKSITFVECDPDIAPAETECGNVFAL